MKKLFWNHESVRGGDVGKLLKFCETAVVTRMKERVGNKKSINFFQVFIFRLKIRNLELKTLKMTLSTCSSTIIPSKWKMFSLGVL